MTTVDSGARLVQRSGATLERIVTAASQVARLVADIASASEDQAREIMQVNAVTVQMSRVTQASAAETAEMAATAEMLAEESRQLQALVAQFRIEDDDGRSPRAGPDPRRGCPRRVPARAPGGGQPTCCLRKDLTRSRSSAACSKSSRRAASRMAASISAIRLARSAGEAKVSAAGASTSTV